LHTVGTGIVVATSFTVKGAVLPIDADVTLWVTTASLAAIGVFGALHTTSRLAAHQILTALRIIGTHLTGQGLSIAELSVGAISIFKAFDALIVETITNLPTRTTKPILSGALIAAFALDAGVPARALVVVATTDHAFTLGADAPISAVGILITAIDAHARLVALCAFAMLP
tara:strand:- start:169 stop:684 length:516 start_codon:yes stop_codon:yes gene_type:complete